MTGELESQIRQKVKAPEAARQLLDTVKIARVSLLNMPFA
jgi:hypothetical protein